MKRGTVLGLLSVLVTVATIIGMMTGFTASAADSSWGDDDAGLSVWVGGDFRTVSWELEGIYAIKGNATVSGLWGGGGNLGGKVNWGLGYSGAPDADTFNVGGDIIVVPNKGALPYIFSSGSLKVGGRIPDGYTAVSANEAVRLGAHQSFANDKSRAPKIGIGREAALNVDLGGGRSYNYNDYADTVSSMSDRMTRYPDTGTATYEAGPDAPFKYQHSNGFSPWEWKVTHVGIVRFHGSGSGAYQSFTLDTDAMAAEGKAKGYRAWGFAFDGIPADTPIYVNVRGRSVSLPISQSYYLNGKNVSVNTNDLMGDKKAFTDLAGRLVWNFNDTDSFHIMSPADVDAVSPKMNGDNISAAAWAINFPGSIVMKRGDARFDVDTNGRIYVNGNLSIVSPEHHNTPFRFYQPSTSIHIEKYDVEGTDDVRTGDRDTAAEALALPAGKTSARIRFDVTNTGEEEVDALSIDDTLVSGGGKLTDISYPSKTILPGQTVTVTATLTGISGSHEDRAVASAIGKVTGNAVHSNADAWHAKTTLPVTPPAGNGNVLGNQAANENDVGDNANANEAMAAAPDDGTGGGNGGVASDAASTLLQTGDMLARVVIPAAVASAVGIAIAVRVRSRK